MVAAHHRYLVPPVLALRAPHALAKELQQALLPAWWVLPQERLAWLQQVRQWMARAPAEGDLPVLAKQRTLARVSPQALISEFFFPLSQRQRQA